MAIWPFEGSQVPQHDFQNDTFCQSWYAFILLYVSHWIPRRHYYYNTLTKEKTIHLHDIFPKPDKNSSKSHRLRIILEFINYWIIETEDNFTFSVKHQLNTQYGEILDNISFEQEINNSIQAYLNE